MHEEDNASWDECIILTSFRNEFEMKYSMKENEILRTLTEANDCLTESIW